MLANTRVVITLQYRNASNKHLAHCKLTQCQLYLNYKKKEKEAVWLKEMYRRTDI